MLVHFFFQERTRVVSVRILYFLTSLIFALTVISFKTILMNTILVLILEIDFVVFKSNYLVKNIFSFI